MPEEAEPAAFGGTIPLESPRATFLTLPPEIRLKIYKEVFTQISIRSVTSTQQMSDVYESCRELASLCRGIRPYYDELPLSVISLLLTSKRLYREAQSVFDRASVMLETNPTSAWLCWQKVPESEALITRCSLPSDFASRVTTLVIPRTGNSSLYADLYMPLNSRFHSAKDVWIILPNNYPGDNRRARFYLHVDDYIFKCLGNFVGPSSLTNESQPDHSSQFFRDLQGALGGRNLTVRLVYYFRVGVMRKSRPPRPSDHEYSVTLVCDTQGVRLEGIPDLQSQWWWEKWHDSNPSFFHPNLQTSSVCFDGPFIKVYVNTAGNRNHRGWGKEVKYL